MLAVVPVGVCSSLVLLGKRRCADSCKGEPVPTLEACARAGPLAFGPEKGDLAVEGLGSVIGDNPDRLIFNCPSGLDVGAIFDDKSVDPDISRVLPEDLSSILFNFSVQNAACDVIVR